MQERLRVAEVRIKLTERKLQSAEGLLRQHGIGLQTDSTQAPSTSNERQAVASVPAMATGNTSPTDQGRLSAVQISGAQQAYPFTTTTATGGHPGDLETSAEEPEIDGMAYLTPADDHDSGYLGVSSGAAMLQSLMHELRTESAAQTLPSQRRGPVHCEAAEGWVPTPLWRDLKIEDIDLDGLIDIYFKTFHMAYPMIHEPTYRAQYAKVVARPDGSSWNALTYAMAAIGAFTSTEVPLSVHWRLVMAARSNVSIAILETGSLTLVQYLALMAYSVQKWNKLNSAFSYMGYALYMAMSIGLHRGDRNRNCSLLDIEIRRRVWWYLYVEVSGAATTFGRPLPWPTEGTDMALPLNILERNLTIFTTTLPAEENQMTVYSSIIWQSRLNQIFLPIYHRIISTNLPEETEMLQIDDMHMEPWTHSIPAWFQDNTPVSTTLLWTRSIAWWRFRNYRIMMYQPYILQRRVRPFTTDFEKARDRCLYEAKLTISSIQYFLTSLEATRLQAWYVLFFLFQASLAMCLGLRNLPDSLSVSDWRQQLDLAVEVMRSLEPKLKAAAQYCEILTKLVNRLPNESTLSTAHMTFPTTDPAEGIDPNQMGQELSAWTNLTGDLHDLMNPGVDWLDSMLVNWAE